ncbi:MAG: two-component regulator propeller domain-containing protein, partial [Saprospiraceae bacterium]
NFEIYNYTNSPILNAVGDAIENNRITGMEFDDEGILWMANNSASTPIVTLAADGTWKAFPVVGGTRSLVQIAIDEADNKWFTTYNNGLMIFNEGDEFDNNSDNRTRHLTSVNSELLSEVTNCLVVDKEGEVWVGTSQGVVIFDCGGNVFDTSNCRGERRIIAREDGNNEYLLKPENVRAIAVDGANRKWFGTENGVFVTSADGLDDIHHFTKDNSPLFSNKINTISINDEGEVFIGTDAGVITYKSDATTGKKIHSSDVYAYPNPVTSDYEGPIAINGLPQNADFKITDINGTLIHEGIANGGQAIWDGKDYNGRKASSGVYLVFSANANNPQNPNGHVAKLLFMK